MVQLSSSRWGTAAPRRAWTAMRARAPTARRRLCGYRVAAGRSRPRSAVQAATVGTAREAEGTVAVRVGSRRYSTTLRRQPHMRRATVWSVRRLMASAIPGASPRRRHDRHLPPHRPNLAMTTSQVPALRHTAHHRRQPARRQPARRLRHACRRRACRRRACCPRPQLGNAPLWLASTARPLPGEPRSLWPSHQRRAPCHQKLAEIGTSE